MTTIKASEVLMAAKDRIVFGDWTQGAWHLRYGQPVDDSPEDSILAGVPAEFDEHDQFCVEGAIASATRMALGNRQVPVPIWGWQNTPECEVGDRIENIFACANGLSVFGGIANWNDSPARTKEEVIDAMDKAIAYAKDLEDNGEGVTYGE